MSTSGEGARKSIAHRLFAVGTRRQPTGPLGHVITAASAALTCWVIYTVVYGRFDPWLISCVFLCGILSLLFLILGASESSHPTRPTIFDWVLSATSIACLVYFSINADYFVDGRIPQLHLLDDWAVAFGSALFLLSLEATRRTTGLGLTMIVLIFVAYNLAGHHIEGRLSHAYISFTDFIDLNVYTRSGILGTPILVAATYAFMFVLFGTLLSRSGGGDFFFNIGAAVAGRQIGGPAKIAVISSGAYGMMSGSSVSDVVTTGSITIPMMKRLGYTPTFAAATEVAASTGGAVMPPVMGAAAFVMVEFTGVPYAEIALSALIPALLYYIAVYAQVHLRAKRLGLMGLAAADIPTIRFALAQGWPFTIPLAVIVGALVAEYTPSTVALYGTAAVIVVGLLLPGARRLKFTDIYAGFSETTWRIMGAAGACAAAGLVIGGVNVTGLALKFAHVVYAITGAELLPTLLLAAVMTLILGLGMPAVSAYILAVALLEPALVGGDSVAGVGVPPLAAHMFLLYYAVLSAMTPPVAVAAYAAAAIADDNPLKIAVAAVRLSIAAFIVPFTFAFGQELLLIGEPVFIAIAVVTALIGILAVAVAAEGYADHAMDPISRILLGAAGLALIYPNVYAAVAGLAVLVGVAAVHYARRGSAFSRS